MISDYIIRHFCGFALQIVPAALLLLLPFEPSSGRFRPRWMWLIFTLVPIGISALYAFTAFSMHVNGLDADGTGYLTGNIFMCAAILVFMILFFLLILDQPLRKLFLFFTVIAFAALQYSLSNALLAFTPDKPASQAGQSYDINTCLAYLIVTAVLFPPVAVFFRISMRKWLKNMNTLFRKREFILLTVMTVLYLALNVILSTFWTQFQERSHINQSFFMPVILLLTAMLFATYYSIVRLSVLRSEEAEREKAAEIVRQEHIRIRTKMEQQREHLHDMRQLLRTLSVLARNGSREELQTYIDETVEHIHIPDKRFCADSCMNSILQYYVSFGDASGLSFDISARCTDTSAIAETDMIVLLGNALENAIRSAKEYHDSHPDSKGSILLIADDSEGLLRIRIENPCDRILYAPSAENADRNGFLPADAYLSTTGSGQGLKRIRTIAEKYDGTALFRFEEKERLFTTNITLILPGATT